MKQAGFAHYGAAAPRRPRVGVDAAWKQADMAETARAVAAQSRPWWQRAGEWLAEQADKISDTLSGIQDTWKVRHLKFNRLEDGHISVSADTPAGTRLAYREVVAEEGFVFEGTRYNPGTVAGRTTAGLVRSSVSKSSLTLAGVVALGQNLWQFGADPPEGVTFWDRTVKNRKFWVSTGVDFAVALAVGVAAAAVVAGAIALLAGTAVGTVLALPAVAIAATLVVGFGISWGLEALRVPERLKTIINNKFTGRGK